MDRLSLAVNLDLGTPELARRGRRFQDLVSALGASARFEMGADDFEAWTVLVAPERARAIVAALARIGLRPHAVTCPDALIDDARVSPIVRALAA